MNNNTKVVLVDEHVLFRKGLAKLIREFDCDVLFDASSGKDLICKLDKQNLPDIVLMDISMPEMDGFEAAYWLKDNYPIVNVLALSAHAGENDVIRMLRSGAKGYIVKDADPLELRTAIHAVMTRGFYYTDMVTSKMVRSIQNDDEKSDGRKVLKLNQREIEFLKLVCTEMTYKEIADHLHLSPRTIDGYRDMLFVKLNVKSRVGLVTFAIKNGIIRLN